MRFDGYRRALIAWALIAMACGCHAEAADDSGEPAKFDLEGYNKTLGIQSRTTDGQARPYDLWLNRTRLKLTYTPTPNWQFRLEDDLELRAGNYLSTDQARDESNAPSRRLWHTRKSLGSNDNDELSNDVYRGYVKWSQGDTDVWLGRQRIALGTGRLWSTVDLLNPLNPLQIERDEYVGVDALRLDQRFSSVSRVTAVYAPAPQGRQPRWTLRYADLVGESELSGTVAHVWDEDRYSLDVASQAGGFGLRGEFTRVQVRQMPDFWATSLGLDYAFPNTLTFAFEAYLSGQSQADRSTQLAQVPLRAFTEPAGTRYLGMTVSYEFTPLLKGVLMFLDNRSDNSQFGSASVSYSLTSDLFVQAGTQRFYGRPETEYGRGQSVYYLQFQAFF